MKLSSRARYVRTSSALLLVAVAVLSCLGCGTGEYNSRLDQRVAELKRSARFDVLYDKPTELPGMAVGIRIPKVFTTPLSANAFVDGKRVDPGRAQPPFMQLPGYRISYEAYQPGGPEIPFYVYLAAVEARSTTKEAFAEMVRGRLDAAFPGATTNWETVPGVVNPDEQPVEWKSIRAVGQQEFLQKQAEGPPAMQRTAGTFVLCLHQSETYYVLVGWRMAGEVNYPPILADGKPGEQALLCLGTVQTGALPSWQPDNGLAANLGEPTAIGSYSFEPPNGYTPAATQAPPGTSVVVLNGPNAGGGQPRLALTVQAVTAGRDVYLSDAAQAYLDGIEKQAQIESLNAQPGAIGKVGDFYAIRSDFSGRVKGIELRGFVMVLVNGSHVIYAYAWGPGDAVKLLETSCLTLK